MCFGIDTVAFVGLKTRTAHYFLQKYHVRLRKKLITEMQGTASAGYFENGITRISVYCGIWTLRSVIMRQNETEDQILWQLVAHRLFLYPVFPGMEWAVSYWKCDTNASGRCIKIGNNEAFQKYAKTQTLLSRYNGKAHAVGFTACNAFILRRYC